MPPRRRGQFGASLTSDGGPQSAPNAPDAPPTPPRSTAGGGDAPRKPKAKGKGSLPRGGGQGGSSSHPGPSNGSSSAEGAHSGAQSGAGGKKGKGKASTLTLTLTSNGQQGKKDNSPAAPPSAVGVTSHSLMGADGAEACIICAEPIRVHAVYPCNHSTCGRCALRLRALYRQSTCVYCKSEAEQVVFTSQPGREYGSFAPQETGFGDDRLGLRFASQEEKESALQLLLFHCPHVGCAHTLPASSAIVAGILPSAAVGTGTAGALPGWSGLKEHAGREHHRSLCELCIQHKKIFTYEHPLYTHRQLAAHHADEHRTCRFCRQHFYGPDELQKHLRDRHFQCQMCAVNPASDRAVRQNEDPDADTDHVARHERRAAEAAATHAARTAAEAQTWFRDYSELERHFDQAHYLCPDPSCREQQYVVFDNEMDYNSHRLREHAGSMTAREKREALRVEAAFGESVRDAGGPPSRARGVPGAPPRPTRRNGLAARRTESTPVPAAQDGETAAQQALLTLATSVLGTGFTSSKLASVRTGLATYRAGEASAADLAATVWSVVDSSPGEADRKVQNGTRLIRGMAEVLLTTPSEGGGTANEKASALLSAWTALGTTRDFPSLGGGSAPASTGTGTRYASAAGSATALRNAGTPAGGPATDLFPALTPSSVPARPAAAPWGAATPPARHRVAPASGTGTSGGAWAPAASPRSSVPSPAAFPTLPQSAPRNLPAGRSVWTSGGAGTHGSPSASSSSTTLPSVGKKGKNKKGQTVIALGSVRR